VIKPDAALPNNREYFAPALPFLLPSLTNRQDQTRSVRIDRGQPKTHEVSYLSRFRSNLRPPHLTATQLDQPPLCEWHSGGRRFDPVRLHQVFSKLRFEKTCHGVAFRRSRATRSRLYRVENYARASQFSIAIGISPSVARAQSARPPAEMIGWPYANHPPSSPPFGPGHFRGLCSRTVAITFRHIG